MTYNKPEVVNLDLAAKAIQGAAKPYYVYTDASYPHPINALTPGAYEADE